MYCFSTTQVKGEFCEIKLGCMAVMILQTFCHLMTGILITLAALHAV